MEAKAYQAQQQSVIILEGREIGPAMIPDYLAYLDKKCRKSQSTITTYQKSIRAFFTWLKKEGIRRPIQQDIIAYTDWLQAPHYEIQPDKTAAGWKYRKNGSGQRLRITCKPATVSLYLHSLSGFFAWTEAQGVYANIAKGIQAPAAETDEGHAKRAFTEAEMRILLKSMEAVPADTRLEKEQRARIKAIVLLAATAGLRTIEISRATIGDLETIDGRSYLYIWGKGHIEARQRKALAQGTYEAIRAYLDLRTDPMRPGSPLFRATGNRSNGGPVLPTTISTWIQRELKGAGISSDRLTAHSLRHTAAMQALKISGNNLFETQIYLRHKNPKTTEIYLREAKQEEQAELADQLFCSITGSL